MYKKFRRRSFSEWAQDVWLAATGKTFVSVKFFCHKCDDEHMIEIYQDILHPQSSSGIGVSYATINDIMYFPSLRARAEIFQGSELKEYYPEDHPQRSWFKKLARRKRSTWKADLVGGPYDPRPDKPPRKPKKLTLAQKFKRWRQKSVVRVD